jgi:hypothetical protein
MNVPQAHCPVLPQGEPTGIPIQKKCQTATPNFDLQETYEIPLRSSQSFLKHFYIIINHNI